MASPHNNVNSREKITYTYKISWSQAKNKLKKFYKVYFQKTKANLKLALLPQWMDEYGRLLELENSRHLPKYFNILRQGTIVMVNFGVGIGSEMSLNHFAVVLTKNDSKFKHKVIVVPLSSKQHPKEGYLPLGYVITDKLVSRLKERSDKMLKLAQKGKENIDYLMKNTSINSQVSPKSYNYFLQHGLDIKDFSKTPFDYSNYRKTKLYTNYQTALRINEELNDKEMSKFLNFLTETFKKSDELSILVQKIQPGIRELETLTKKAKKYNNQTYADVGNITTVSKLRIIKFSKFNISENTQVSQDVIDKILNRLNDFI